jgi:hypothetical protein
MFDLMFGVTEETRSREQESCHKATVHAACSRSAWVSECFMASLTAGDTSLAEVAIAAEQQLFKKIDTLVEEAPSMESIVAVCHCFLLPREMIHPWIYLRAGTCDPRHLFATSWTLKAPPLTLTAELDNCACAFLFFFNRLESNLSMATTRSRHHGSWRWSRLRLS